MLQLALQNNEVIFRFPAKFLKKKSRKTVAGYFRELENI
jgi:hypothetical protein